MNEVKVSKGEFYRKAELTVGKDSMVETEIRIDRLASSDEVDIEIENSYNESVIISVTRQQLRDLVEGVL